MVVLDKALWWEKGAFLFNVHFWFFEYDTVFVSVMSRKMMLNFRGIMYSCYQTLVAAISTTATVW